MSKECGFQLYRHFQQLDQLQSCLIQLAIAMNHKDGHFKFQNCSRDVKSHEFKVKTLLLIK